MHKSETSYPNQEIGTTYTTTMSSNKNTLWSMNQKNAPFSQWKISIQFPFSFHKTQHEAKYKTRKVKLIRTRVIWTWMNFIPPFQNWTPLSSQLPNQVTFHFSKNSCHIQIQRGRGGQNKVIMCTIETYLTRKFSGLTVIYNAPLTWNGTHIMHWNLFPTYPT